MTISELASVGEFVSGVAVLISLVYLTVQVRQAKQNQRAVLNQGYILQASAATQWMGEPARAALLAKISDGATEFASDERVQIFMMTRVVILNCQDAHGQYKAGLIDRMTYDNAILVLGFWFRTPVFRAVWRVTRPSIAPEFRGEIDKVIAEMPMGARDDDDAAFRDSIAQVMAEAASAVTT